MLACCMFLVYPLARATEQAICDFKAGDPAFSDSHPPQLGLS